LSQRRKLTVHSQSANYNCKPISNKEALVKKLGVYKN
jgi:hypothetical protein